MSLLGRRARGLTLALPLVIAAGILIPGVCRAQKPGKGDFLVAGRDLRDPNFSRTVVLLIGYDPEGAMGLVINRRTHVPVSEVFTESEELRRAVGRIYLGGPVSLNQFFILVQTKHPSAGSLHLLGNLYLSDQEFLQGMLGGGGQEEFRVYAGYAGWGASQLDREIDRGDWHVLPGDEKSVFSEEPATVWEVLIERSNAVWAMRTPREAARDETAPGTASTGQ